MLTPFKSSPLKSKKATHRKCLRRGLVHVYRFLRYVDGFNPSVRSDSPDRFPKVGVFRCTECGDEVVLKIRHRG